MTKLGQRNIFVLIVALFVLLAASIVALDWDEIPLIFGKTQWSLALGALLIIIISYFCLSFGYVLVNWVFGIKIGWGKSLEIGILSTTINNLVGFMGVAGHSMRVGLLKGSENDAGQVLAASLFHSYLNNVIVILMLALGLISLLVSQIVYGGSAIGLAVIAVLTVISLVVSTGIIFVPRLKSRILSLTKTVWHFVTHRDIAPFLADVDHGLTDGLIALKSHPAALTLILGLMVVELALQALALWFCFAAFGNVPDFAVLLSGFGIGLSAGALSFVPGGLGVQDASMAGIFSLLGMSFTQAALVAILFRVVSDFIPFLLSLPFYIRVVRRL